MAADPHRLLPLQLASSPLFHGLPQTLLAQMASRFRLRRLQATQTLDPRLTTEYLFLILEGRVKVLRSHPDTGRNLVLFLLGSGDLFDVVTLLDDQPHPVEAVTIDPVQLAAVPLAEVRRWLTNHAEFNRRFLPYLGELCRRMETLATDLALHDTASRLARLILRHTDPNSSSAEAPLPVRLIADLKHEELAHMLGSVRQVVNQHLQALRRKGVLVNQRGRLLVNNLAALERQAGELLHHLSNHHHTSPPHEA